MKLFVRRVVTLNVVTVGLAIAVAFLLGMRDLQHVPEIFALVGAGMLLLAAGASTSFPTSMGGYERMVRIHDEMTLTPDLGLDDSRLQVTRARMFLGVAVLTFVEAGVVAFAASFA